MEKVSLIVPCYNEEAVLEIFYSEITEVMTKCSDYNFEVIYVDDGSSDKTLEILHALAQRDSRMKFISFSRNFGKESAMLAGLNLSSGDYVGILDADLQHSPDMIPQMLDAVTQEGYDVAAARRIQRKDDSKVKNALSRQFYKVINHISDVEIAEGSQDFRVMKRKVVDAILSLSEYNRFSKGIFSWVGFHTKWFEHEDRERAAGKTKWSFSKLLRYAIDGIISFSTAPLRIALYLGLFASISGVIYALYIIIKTIIDGADVPGFPSLMSGILVFGGLILFALGIIGEYLSRLYIEVKNRPHYIIDETNIIPAKRVADDITRDNQEQKETEE